MFCTHCGHKMEEDSRFCPNCGAPAEPEPAAPQAGEPDTPVLRETDAVPTGETAEPEALPEEGSSPCEPEKEDSCAKCPPLEPDIPDNLSNISPLDEQGSSREVPENTPAASKNGGRKKALFWGVGAAVLAVLAACFLFSWLNRPADIDLNAYITVDFSGYDTLGQAQVLFDRDRFLADYQGKIRCRGKLAASLKEKARDREELRSLSLERLLEEVQAYTLEPAQDLKNGDKVMLHWELDSRKLESDFRIRLSFHDREFPVEGLENVEIVDVMSHFQVSFQNYDPCGTARITYETAPWLDDSVSLSLDRQENLKNGDTVTLTVDIPQERIQEYLDREGVLLDLGSGSKLFTVAGLPVSEAGDLEPVTLKVWFHGSTVTPDASAQVLEQLNPYLQYKLNVTLEPVWGTWGDFDANVPMALQSGERVDIVFTSDWSGNEYNQFAAQGYYVKLDEMLDTYAPELKATIPQPVWNCVRTNGREGMGIYGIPALTDTANQNGWLINADRLNALGFNPDSIEAGWLDYYSADFEAMLQAAKDQGGEDFYPLVIEPQILERMVDHCAAVAGSMNSMLGYSYDPADPSRITEAGLVNRFATQEFADFTAKTYEFARKGFISPECMEYNANTQYRSQAMAEGTFLFVTADYTFGMEKALSGASGTDIRMVPASAPYADAMSCQKAMMAISHTSENPERALMFLNLLNTDPKAMTMLNYGLEDFTYRDNNDGTVDFLQINRENYFPWTFGMGNVRLLPPTTLQGVDYWEEFGAFYDSAQALPYTGFVFDSRLVAVENEQVDSVIMKYAYGLCSGALDPEENLPEFLKALNQAGAQTLLHEATQQMEAYLESTDAS